MQNVSQLPSGTNVRRDRSAPGRTETRLQRRVVCGELVGAAAQMRPKHGGRGAARELRCLQFPGLWNSGRALFANRTRGGGGGGNRRRRDNVGW